MKHWCDDASKFGTTGCGVLAQGSAVGGATAFSALNVKITPNPEAETLGDVDRLIGVVTPSPLQENTQQHRRVDNTDLKITRSDTKKR